jgi:hypothetical protein
VCAGTDGTAVTLDIARDGGTNDEATSREAAEALMRWY